MTPRGLFLCRIFSTAGLLPLLPTSRNGPSGLGRAEAFWNSFSCDPSIAVASVSSSFPLSQASMGPRSSGEVVRQHASARSNQRFANSFLCLEPILCRMPVLPYTFAGLTFARLTGRRGANDVCAAEVRCSRWLGRASRANRRKTIRGAVETTRSVGSTLR